MRAINDAGADQQLSSATEALLLEGIRQGSEGCFEEVFRRHRETVYAVLFRLCGDREDAEDLTQEVFLQLYRRTPAKSSDPNIGGWLYRVAMNVGYNALRSRKRSAGRLDRAIAKDSAVVIRDESAAGPDEQALVREERIRVRTVLLAMGERSRNCLILRQSGLSYSEIARTLEIAPGSVGTILARAEKEFRDKYSAKYGDDQNGS